MAHVTSPLAEPATPMDVVSTAPLPCALPQREQDVAMDTRIQLGTTHGVQETQSMETQSTDVHWSAPIQAHECKTDQTVAQVADGSSRITDDESRATEVAAAKAATLDCGTSHVSEATQTTWYCPSGCASVAATAAVPLPIVPVSDDTDLDAHATSLDEEAKASVAPETPREYAPVNERIRLPRAAATAAIGGMARQAKQEARASVLEAEEGMNMDVDMGHNSKKRTTRGTRPAAKRSRVRASRNTLERGSVQKASPRVRKRRQVSASRARPTELSPVITDLPPLPFTSTSVSKNKTKAMDLITTGVENDSDGVDGNDGDRCCEFCNKEANVCVLMHCRACRRVYHAQCFVHAFKPYVDEQLPIWDQIKRLQLEAPERRGDIFCCASCKAAFSDFYASGGYLWDCDCVTCSQPEKALLYRQRKLVQMMNGMDLERRRKRERNGRKKTGTSSASEKPPGLSKSGSSNLTPRSRKRGSSAVADDPIVCSPNSRQSTSATQDASLGGDVLMNMQPVGELKQSELSGDDLIDAVDVLQSEKNGGWCFPVVCSRTLSSRESGITKTGKCTWSPQEQSTIHCNCCDKAYILHDFVSHTDNSLITFAHASKSPMSFLFVEHRDGTEYSLLGDFQPALRSWHDRQSMEIPIVESCHSNDTKQEAPVAAETPAIPVTNSVTITDVPQTSVSRIQALALFKRPKLEGCEPISIACSVYPATLNYVAQVVCLSPKYVMNMQNGALADRVVRSRTPAPEDSFPRKAGWLAFSRNPVSARQIVCFCCKHDFSFDEFVGHAGISLTELQKKPSQLLYVVERQDKSALVPFNTFLSDLDYVTINGVDSFLDELQPPPSSPFPI
ncbi:unnamed protein product [Hyaloperonospora brassicae]|uniref:Tify domain-containing protein n=1 Tax=Hyaloperonospora brassicae TaxID=162125 RepID=A0AAV0U133_HYABA|nr:unnamed protein product [Hyaloperonospora brassicae]